LSASKSDRGIVEVETRGYNQDGTVVCVFRRKVMVPTQAYVKEHGGERPARPEPAAPSPPRPEIDSPEPLEPPEPPEPPQAPNRGGETGDSPR
jgi:hypothetical protein